MGVAVPQALVGGWGPGPPQKFGHCTGPSLLVNCYLGNKFQKNSGWSPLLKQSF